MRIFRAAETVLGCFGGRTGRAWTALGLMATLVAGCGGGQAAASDGKIRVVATISVIQNLAKEVGGDRVEASAIVPVGGSPETFQPRPSQAAEISEARVVFTNGLGLDGWATGLVESAGNEDQAVVELSKGPETMGGGEHAGANPHLWLDVSNAERYVEKIRDALIKADPRGAKEYGSNARRYLAELRKLDGYIDKRAGSIPEGRRDLVTLHDAFPYFAEAYGFDLVGVVIANPNAEPGGRDVARVVRTIEREGVPAVFAEPQFNAALAETVAREADVEVYELYSDTLGEGRTAGTYEAMMRTDINRIVEALG